MRVYLEMQKGFQNSCITKVHPNMGDRSQSWEPGTACRQLNVGESFLGDSVGPLA